MNKPRFASVFILLFLLCVTTLLYAASTECPSHYLSGIAPDIVSAKKTVKARELCFESFGIMHSGITKTPLWSAEYLKRSSLVAARNIRRVDNFHAEERLSADERAELRDYSRSGFDRGHMAPSADMPTRNAQAESFSLANIIPQDPNNNRNLWEGIEAAVRAFAKKTGELYVITGPLYLGSRIKQLNGRLLVPTHIFKIVFNPGKNIGGAYLVENKPGSAWKGLSIAELEEIAEINFFPVLSASVKELKMDLPAPVPYDERKSKSGGAAKDQSVGYDFSLKRQFNSALRSIFR